MATMTVSSTALRGVVLLFGLTCAQQHFLAQTPLQIPNPHYISINESVIVNAPVDKVWARVGKFCDITEWMNSPEWENCRYLQGHGGPGSAARVNEFETSVHGI